MMVDVVCRANNWQKLQTPADVLLAAVAALKLRVFDLSIFLRGVEPMMVRGRGKRGRELGAEVGELKNL
jgi:hypothetical protein